jgi:DNA-binding response OmpR family regulator
MRNFSTVCCRFTSCDRYKSSAPVIEQVWKLNFDTMTNVVDVYIDYLRRKVDTGYDRALIRTVRGVGYQIGGSSATPRSTVLAATAPI